MSYRIKHIIRPFVGLAAGVLAASTIAACSSAALGGEADPSLVTAADSTCGGGLSGSYAVLNSDHLYPTQSLNVGCVAAGATVSVSVSANDVPNKFTIMDVAGNAIAGSGWLGVATYSGPWGASLSNSGTASLSFISNNGPYSIKVETVTPPNGSYPHTTDIWSVSASCQCAPPPPVHYSCGYAMANDNCDNGRTHVDITAADMNAAIAACKATRPTAYPDFCYVLDREAATSSDITECAAQGSWRAGNSCCNFEGTKSCPS